MTTTYRTVRKDQTPRDCLPGCRAAILTGGALGIFDTLGVANSLAEPTHGANLHVMLGPGVVQRQIARHGRPNMILEATCSVCGFCLQACDSVNEWRNGDIRRGRRCVVRVTLDYSDAFAYGWLALTGKRLSFTSLLCRRQTLFTLVKVREGCACTGNLQNNVLMPAPRTRRPRWVDLRFLYRTHRTQMDH